MKDFLTTEEVAIELGVSTSRVRQILLSGELVADKEGTRYRGFWKIYPEQVEKYKQIRRKPGKPRK